MQCQIGGHTFDLCPGHRYLASSPMANRRGEKFTVTITDITGGHTFQNEIARIKGLTYDAANDLSNTFNNGATTFDGRSIPDSPDC